MTLRARNRLVLALSLAPVLVLPSLWPDISEPRFLVRNLDILIIFFGLPWSVALWLRLKAKGRSARRPASTAELSKATSQQQP